MSGSFDFDTNTKGRGNLFVTHDCAAWAPAAAHTI